MAQKPFIADMGARLGEWLITQNSDGHLAVGPVDVTTNSQRAFRADAGLKIGDWKFYEQGNHLNITPNGVSTVGLPTEYDYTDVESASVSLGVGFNHPNVTRKYHRLGIAASANSTHAFFLEGDLNNGYTVYAVNLSTNSVDWTINPPTGSSNRINDAGIQANEQYLLVSTTSGGRLYSLSTQQLVGTITGGYSNRNYKMSDNYVAYLNSGDVNQVDVRELDPDNNFPLVNSFTGTWGPNPSDTGSLSDPNNVNTNTQFGYSDKHFDLSDTHIVIGAPMYKYDYQGTVFDDERLGKVEVFNIQTGALEHRFYGRDGTHHITTPSSEDIKFGDNISIDGDNVAIKSTTGSNVTESSIRVYNYKTGGFVTSIDKPARLTGSGFYNDIGENAFVLKDGLVFAHVDSYADTDATRWRRTAIFVYNFDGDQITVIHDPDFDAVYSTYDFTAFGKDSLAISGNKLVIGSYAYSTVSNNQLPGFQEGKGYIFDLTKTYAEVAQVPVTTNSSQRPFLMDAGLKIGDWTFTQNGDGDISVSLSGSTAISSGTVPVPTLDPTALTNSTTMTGLRVDHRVGRKLYLKNNELMSYQQYPDRSVTIYDTTTNTVLYDYNWTFGPKAPSYGGDQADFNSTYFAVGCTSNDKVNLYNKSDGTIAHEFTSTNGSFGKIISMNENYIAISTPSSRMVHLYSLDTFAYIDHITTTSGENHADTTKLTDDNKFVIPTYTNNGSKQVHIYDVSGTGFTLDKTITEPNGSGNGNELFGRYNIDMDDTHLVVTANLNYSGINQYLVAYVFDIGTGNLVSTLEHPSMIANDAPNFANIALNGNYAYYTDAAENHMKGSLTVFDITTGSIVASVSNPKWDASWGYGVAVNDSALYVGGHDADNNGTNSGTIWVYTN